MIEIQILSDGDDFDQKKLSEFDQHFSYPLGSDFFSLDHGHNYFHFFRRLGEPRFLLAWSGGDLIGVVGCVLRTLPFQKRKVWYLCDLKIRPDFQGKRLVHEFLKVGLSAFLQDSSWGYGLSMDREDGSNPVVSFVTRLNGLGFENRGKVYFYLFPKAFEEKFKKLLEGANRTFGWLSLSGSKDLVLHSTGEILSLSHLVWGAAAGNAGSTDYLLASFWELDPLNQLIQKAGFSVSATASLLSNLPREVDWSFLTSDQV